MIVRLWQTRWRGFAGCANGSAMSVWKSEEMCHSVAGASSSFLLLARSSFVRWTLPPQPSHYNFMACSQKTSGYVVIRANAADRISLHGLKTLLYDACLLWPPYVIGGPLYFCPVISIVYRLFFSSPNLSGRRLDVCHTLTHGVALVRI